MKRITYSISLLLTLITTSAVAQIRYVDSIFSKIKTETFIYSDTLKLDFYSAKKDEVVDKPLFILIHGGGFAEGKRDNPLEKRFCVEMAQKGYAVASISYRLTRKGKSFGCDCPSNEKLATFRASTEDVLRASSFLVSKAPELGFDPNKMILVGSSAGAEVVLNTVYMQYHRDFQRLPYGSLKFAAIVSFAGAVVNADYITAKNAIPAIFFHGKADRLVPFETAPHHYCKDTTAGFLMLDGSRSIARKLKKLDTPYTLYYDPKGNHDWANLAYSYTDEIGQFIKEVLIDDRHVQTTINLNPEK